MLNILERDEECAKILRGVPKVQEEVVVNRLAQETIRALIKKWEVDLATRWYTRGEREKGVLDENFEPLKNLSFLPNFNDPKKKRTNSSSRPSSQPKYSPFSQLVQSLLPLKALVPSHLYIKLLLVILPNMAINQPWGRI